MRMKLKLNRWIFIIFSIIIANFLNPALAIGNISDSQNSILSIPIAMATDNNYFEPTLVSIVSASENANTDTKLRFYIMVTNDFSEENKIKIQKLNEKLPNCEIRIIEMSDTFSDFEKGRWGTAMYYRLKLGSVLKNESKCIYLDSDTLVLKDLGEMYRWNIGDNYVAGTPDGFRLCESYAPDLGIADMSQYICSGSLLWNLDKVREDNTEEKFEEYLKNISEEGRRLIFPDQDVINAVCYGKIIDMPFKYGAIVGFMYCPKYEKDPYLYRLIEKSSWEDGMKNTVVLHFVGKKPWNSCRVKFANLWHKYYSDLEKYDITE